MNGLSSDLQVGKAGQHLVCCELLKQGYAAFLADESMPFDVIVYTPQKLIKIQVKTSTKTNSTTKSQNLYRYHIRRGKGNIRVYTEHEVDIAAFVALDINQIAYIHFKNLKQCMEFRSPYVEYGRKYGKYINEFPFDPKKI